MHLEPPGADPRGLELVLIQRKCVGRRQVSGPTLGLCDRDRQHDRYGTVVLHISLA